MSGPTLKKFAFDSNGRTGTGVVNCGTFWFGGGGPGGERADAKAAVIVREDGSLLVDGALPIEDLRELLGAGALPGEDEHDYHTAAGMAIAHFGRIPNTGEHYAWGGWRVEVVDLDGPRVDKLLLQRLDDDEAGDDL